MTRARLASTDITTLVWYSAGSSSKTKVSVETEGLVHRFGARAVAAFGQAAEADVAGAVDDQRAGQLGDAARSAAWRSASRKDR